MGKTQTKRFLRCYPGKFCGASCRLPDPEATTRAVATGHALVVRLLRQAAETGEIFPPTEKPVSHLSEEGSKAANIILQTLKAPLETYRTRWSFSVMQLAALDLLALEKSGVILTAEMARTLPLDPITSQPYVFDPGKRTLSVPDAAGSEKAPAPLTLPW